MDSQTPYFIISLDFELYWGVFDKLSLEAYGQHIKDVHIIVPELLNIFNKNKINATWATVGFLLAKDKSDLLSNQPKHLPGYLNKKLSAYPKIKHIGENESEDPCHYAYELVQKILKTPGQELASHTYAHYYCLEEGQTPEEFKADLNAFNQAAKKLNTTIKSLVFPRNQTNAGYLKLCQEQGIITYRGNQKSKIYEALSDENETLGRRFLRLLDSYLNLSGYHSVPIQQVKQSFPFNIPASRFLRPFSKKLRFFEPLKLSRIKSEMTHAAQKGHIYHLWWHPHNFGVNIDENFNILNNIIQHFISLRKTYNMQSITMGDLGEQILSERTT